MRVTECEKLAYFDIDSTIIKRTDNGLLTLDYYGQPWTINSLPKNIEFLKSLKRRGYYIIVHSSNGWLHAKNVIELLKLEQYVDEVKTKPLKYCDDEPVQKWFGPRIYLD